MWATRKTCTTNCRCATGGLKTDTAQYCHNNAVIKKRWRDHIFKSAKIGLKVVGVAAIEEYVKQHPQECSLVFGYPIPNKMYDTKTVAFLVSYITNHGLDCDSRTMKVHTRSCGHPVSAEELLWHTTAQNIPRSSPQPTGTCDFNAAALYCSAVLRLNTENSQEVRQYHEQTKIKNSQRNSGPSWERIKNWLELFAPTLPTQYEQPKANCQDKLCDHKFKLKTGESNSKHYVVRTVTITNAQRRRETATTTANQPRGRGRGKTRNTPQQGRPGQPPTHASTAEKGAIPKTTRPTTLATVSEESSDEEFVNYNTQRGATMRNVLTNFFEENYGPTTSDQRTAKRYQAIDYAEQRSPEDDTMTNDPNPLLEGMLEEAAGGQLQLEQEEDDNFGASSFGPGNVMLNEPIQNVRGRGRMLSTIWDSTTESQSNARLQNIKASTTPLEEKETSSIRYHALTATAATKDDQNNIILSKKNISMAIVQPKNIADSGPSLILPQGDDITKEQLLTATLLAQERKEAEIIFQEKTITDLKRKQLELEAEIRRQNKSQGKLQERYDQLTKENKTLKERLELLDNANTNPYYSTGAQTAYANIASALTQPVLGFNDDRIVEDVPADIRERVRLTIKEFRLEMAERVRRNNYIGQTVQTLLTSLMDIMTER